MGRMAMMVVLGFLGRTWFGAEGRVGGGAGRAAPGLTAGGALGLGCGAGVGAILGEAGLGEAAPMASGI